jgi:hypothetical protein
MRRKCCAKVLMSRSPHAAAESCTGAIRRATRFRALPDFQFFSMSLPVCSYFAPSLLISFFISTTNKGTGSGQCFPRAGLPQWALHFGPRPPVGHDSSPVVWRVKKREQLNSGEHRLLACWRRLPAVANFAFLLSRLPQVTSKNRNQQSQLQRCVCDVVAICDHMVEDRDDVVAGE